MPTIPLLDGSHRSFDHPVSVMDAASDIGPGLVRATPVGRDEGMIVDINGCNLCIWDCRTPHEQ